MNRPVFLSPAARTQFQMTLPGLCSLAVLLQLFVPGLTAQESSGQALRVIEPRLTRIIGSDTLEMQEPALSPDGRWVLFSTGNPGGGGYIYIVSSEDGDVRRLIDDPNVLEPAWFPGGDRIAYWSRENQAIMTAAFDGTRGEVSGRAQRVTLDRALSWFRLAPDGKWIAYRTGDGERMAIKVIPAIGGTARTLDARAELIFLMDWSADGQYIYYRARTIADQDVSRTFRVAVAGGAPEEVRDPPSGGSAPRVPYRIARVSGGQTEGSPFEVQTYDGSPVARIALPGNAETEQAGRGFSADSRRLLTVVTNEVHVLRVLPVAGGSPRQLGDARASETPLGWSPDGAEVLFATTLDGRSAILRAPVTGGAAREIGPMPDRGPPTRDAWANPITFSADARYLTYSRPTPGSTDRTLVVRPVAGGEGRVITGSLVHHEGFRLVGPGGTPNIAGSDFLYMERKGDQVELRAVPPEGSPRLIRSFAGSDVGIGKAKGVFGDRVAYPEYPENARGMWGSTDPTNNPPRILVARGPSGAAKEVAKVPGVFAFDDIVWSPDGRWIAATTFVASETDYIKVLVVGVTPDGDVSSPPRLLATSTAGSAWGLRWLPDGSAVTLYGQSLPDMGFDVWLIPVRNSGPPVSLTRDDSDAIVFNMLSPDGRFLAYQAWVERGTSLWLADLGDALPRPRD